MRQHYTQPELQTVLNEYANLGAIHSYELFNSGFDNSNYSVLTDKGHFVVKIYEAPSIAIESVFFELEAMRFLRQHDARITPIHINNQGSLLSFLHNKPAAVLDFIVGKEAYQQSMTDQLVTTIGQEVGRIDNLLRYFLPSDPSYKPRQNYEWDLKHFDRLAEYLPFVTSKETRERLTAMLQRFNDIKSTLSALPSGFIHNDINQGNVLIHDGELAAILDFSDMVQSPYIQNIAIAIAYFCFMYDFQPQRADIMLNAYRKEHDLSSEELELLYELIPLRFAMRILIHSYEYTLYHDARVPQIIEDQTRFLDRYESRDTFEA